jgi:hypothetical protein
MHNTVCWLSLALMITMAAVQVQAQTSQTHTKRHGTAAAETTTTQVSPKAPEGWTVVEEDVVVVFADEPEEHFHKARENFLKKDARAAAAEIRTGVAFLKLEAGRATGEATAALTASIQELEKLAQGVEKGTVASAQELEQAFARADQALARQHYQQASESWARKESKKAGYELKAAATSIEQALAWAGRKLEAGTVAVIKDAGLVAGKLIEGTGWATDEVSKGIAAVGEELEKLGRLSEPAKA